MEEYRAGALGYAPQRQSCARGGGRGGGDRLLIVGGQGYPSLCGPARAPGDPIGKISHSIRTFAVLTPVVPLKNAPHPRTTVFFPLVIPSEGGLYSHQIGGNPSRHSLAYVHMCGTPKSVPSGRSEQCCRPLRGKRPGHSGGRTRTRAA